METVINFCKRFTFDLSHAVWYSAIEYDTELQRTKTTTQRVFIWLAVLILTLLFITALVYGVWRLLDSIEIKGI
jgi:hypothetical protein